MPNDDAKTNHHKRRRNTSHDLLLIGGAQSLGSVMGDVIRPLRGSTIFFYEPDSLIMLVISLMSSP